MSTEVKDGVNPPVESAPADELKNLKSEFSRKLTNQEATIAQLLASQQALMAQLEAAKPKSAAPQEKLEELMYSNPAEYSRRIKEEAKAEMNAQLQAERNYQSKQQQVIASLAAEFPEINNMEHPLTKRAVEIYNGFSAEDKANPKSYSDAVKTAALEEGIRPKSKRSADESESFSLGSSAPASRTERKTKKDELDPRTEAFAIAVGLDLSKPEVKARLINKHGRKTYNNWG